MKKNLKHRKQKSIKEKKGKTRDGRTKITLKL